MHNKTGKMEQDVEGEIKKQRKQNLKEKEMEHTKSYRQIITRS